MSLIVRKLAPGEIRKSMKQHAVDEDVEDIDTPVADRYLPK
jgi:hypothetical protein